MKEQQVSRFKRKISDVIQLRGLTLEEAAEEVRQDAIIFGLPAEVLQCIDMAADRYREEMQQVEYLEVHALQRKNREPWYARPEDNGFWADYRRYLLDDKGWSKEAVSKIDSSSTRIISLLDNPGLPKFSTRGLVVGYVQSGKTANMTGVMAKAADSNFRFFLVLSGLTDALREQTQIRLESDLVDRDHSRWHLWTTADADFVETKKPGFPDIKSVKRQMAVVKKNKHVLDRFIQKLENTDSSIRRNLPFMIIDDECDQASLNSSRYMDVMTAINEKIRTIINMLPRCSYIGYTATPFANVLVDPAVRVDEDSIDDLYPKDFIVSLPCPDAYFGAEKLFGRDLLEYDEEEPDDQGLDMIRSIPAEEIDSLRPKSRKDKDTFIPEITASLRKAILYYILAATARHVRGDADKHVSMLVHTTVYINPHFEAQGVIRTFLGGIITSLEQNKSGLISELREIWEEEHPRIRSSDFQLTPVPFGDLLPHLGDLTASIETVVENGGSEERLDYTPVVENGAERGRRFIVVGGSVLARGLTIEGLIVSYFVRSSSQYDTLMQMGRWFGYRPNYQDLPRVWMPDDLVGAFRDLAMVEAEIRYDIDVYKNEGVTPLEFAVRIRQIPGMAITAKNKMLHAEDCSVSFGGEHLQTFKFRHEDLDWLMNNWQAGADLVTGSIQSGCDIHDNSDRGRWLGNVPVSLILQFLQHYRIHSSQERMNIERIREYILAQNEKADGALALWNVGIIEPKTGRDSEQPLGEMGVVKTNRRSKYVPTSKPDADIKGLMSKADILIDIPGRKSRKDDKWETLKESRIGADGKATPLLLLYAIDKTSEPASAKSTDREPLNAVMDVLGIGIIFPGAKINTAIKYKRVVLPDSEFEEAELPEIEEES